jgi:hypothetical protein
MLMLATTRKCQFIAFERKEDGVDKGSVSILVDNERFVDPNITARVDVIARSEIMNSLANSKQIYSSTGTSTCTCDLLIFIYGSQHDRTRELYDNILHRVLELQKCNSNPTPTCP